MSLFDDNFVSVLEAENAEAKAKEAEADDKKKKKAADDDAEGGDDAAADNAAAADDAEGGNDEECNEEDENGEPVEPSDEEKAANKAAAESAVDMDINADSIEEAYGFDRLVSPDVEEAHYACLEAVTMNIAFDRADVTCTEAYVNAKSSYEKSVVTETFSESVKKYAARFKAFLNKIKNMVIRIFNKAVNYVKILAARVVAKFSSLRGIEGKKINDKVEIKVHEELLADTGFDALAKKICGPDQKAATDLQALMMSLKSKSAEAAKSELDSIKPKDKSELIAAVYKASDKPTTVKLAGRESDVKKWANQLKQSEISKAVDCIKTERDNMFKSIENAKKAGKDAADIDTAKMSVLTGIVNRLMTIFNRRVSAMVTLLLSWINARAKAVRAAGWNSEKGTPTNVPVKASAYSDGSLFDKYFEML